MDDEDDGLVDTDGGDEIDEDDIEEEILMGEDGDSDDEAEILEAFDDEIEGEEGDWEDDEEDALDEEDRRAGDELIFDGEGPIQAMDDEDDIDDGDNSEGFTDEEEVLTGELEFDPEMTEQLRASSTAQAYGWDPVTGGDGSTRRNRHGLPDELMELGGAGMFDRPRNLNTAPAHPLLVEGQSEARVEAAARRSRGANATARDSPAYQEWVRSVEAMLGPNGVNTLQEVLAGHGLSHLNGPDQLRIQLAPGPDGGMAVVIDPSPGLRAAQQAAVATETPGHRHHVPSRSTARQLSDRINAASAFLPVQTSQRWAEEGRILQGPSLLSLSLSFNADSSTPSAGCVLIAERGARLMKHIVNVLHAPARAEAKEAAKEAAKKAAEQAEKDRLREEELNKTRRAELEQAEKERVEEEEKEKAKREEEARLQEEAAATAAVASAEMEVDNAGGEEISAEVAEVMNLARSLAAGLAVPSTGSSTPARSDTPSTSASTAAAQAAPAAAAEASTSDQPVSMNAEASGSGENQPAERVTILVHGEEVDITDTGIDREFLEALPDDMREEVIRQHLRESRRATGPAPPIPSDMDAEFLNALPPDVRAEVIRGAAAEQRRSQAASASASRGEAAAAAAAAAPPVDMDPHDFLATLDPALRGAVLTEDNDEDEDDMADNRAFAAINGANVGRVGRTGETRARGVPAAAADAAKKPATNREVIQLLDKSGLATLVRLLFFPHSLRRNVLQKTLTNLCENNRTRVELINLLLTILHDGTRDVAAVDKSFSQMSIRASKALGGNKDTPRRRVPETPGGALPHLPGESVPNLIAQRCLEALLFLVSANEQTPLFFLTEQEISVTKRTSKKGKGKEKVRFPFSSSFDIQLTLPFSGYASHHLPRHHPPRTLRASGSPQDPRPHGRPYHSPRHHHPLPLHPPKEA